MSRRQPPITNGYDSQGRKLCACGCQQPLPPNRQTWASSKCYHGWRLIHHQGTIRKAIYRRDKGICAICSINASAAFKAIKHEARTVPKHEHKSRWPTWTLSRRTGWDADHIIPITLGGLYLGLANIRTLCQPCHKRVTKELRQNLKQKKSQ